MRIPALAPVLLGAFLLPAPLYSALASQTPAMDAANTVANNAVVDTNVDRDIAVFPDQKRYWAGDLVWIAEHKGDNGFLSSDIIGYKQPRAEIGLRSDNAVYEGGDEAKVTFETGHVGGYVVVFQVGPDGFARVIYPATPVEDNYVRGDQVVAIDGPAGHGSFTVEQTGGTGLLLAMISRDHLELESFAEDGAWKPAATRITAPTAKAIGDDWGQLYWELIGMVRTTTSSLFASQVISYTVVDPIATHAQIFGPLLATDSLGFTPARTQYASATSGTLADQHAVTWQAAQAIPGQTYCERLWTTIISSCCPGGGPYACDDYYDYFDYQSEHPDRSMFVSQCYYPKNDGTCRKVDGPGPNQGSPDARLVSAVPPISGGHGPVVTPWRPPPIGTFAGGNEPRPGGHSRGTDAGSGSGGAGSHSSNGGGFGPASSPGATVLDRGGETRSSWGGSGRSEPASSGGGYSGGGGQSEPAQRAEPAPRWEPSSSGPMSEPSRGGSSGGPASSGPASSGGEAARPVGGGGRPPAD